MSENQGDDISFRWATFNSNGNATGADGGVVATNNGTSVSDGAVVGLDNGRFAAVYQTSDYIGFLPTDYRVQTQAVIRIYDANGATVGSSAAINTNEDSLLENVNQHAPSSPCPAASSRSRPGISARRSSRSRSAMATWPDRR